MSISFDSIYVLVPTVSYTHLYLHLPEQDGKWRSGKGLAAADKYSCGMDSRVVWEYRHETEKRGDGDKGDRDMMTENGAEYSTERAYTSRRWHYRHHPMP
tara:strand:- start:87 stop:386 length:300 start_codon:yes stop_codon:yes gene_type:complete